MSNPSVFELARTEIEGSQIIIEDNIGEAIHLHIGAFRIDLTIKEFKELSEKLEKVLLFLTEKKNIKLENYHPYFLLYFSAYLLKILKIEEKELKLKDLKVKYIEKEESKILPLKNSPFYSYYKGENIALEAYENFLDIFQSNKERADFIYKELSENPKNKEKIIIDKENFLLYGEEQAAALLALYGEDYKVKVEIFFTEEEITLGRRLKKLW